jgi:hippurate hydrolase
MIKDGLFKKFPLDEVYGLHNAPQLNPQQVAVFPGPTMASADFFDITITGYGSHGAMPEMSRDPVVIAMTLGQALQTIVSRNIDPLKSAVLSITQIHAGSAYNVIPGEATLAGTVRTFSEKVREQIRDRIRTIAAGMATAFQVEIKVDIRDIFSVLVNHDEPSHFVADVAREVVGSDNVLTTPTPKMGSEDFADMLLAVPGLTSGSAMKVRCRCTIRVSSSTTRYCRSGPACSRASSKTAAAGGVISLRLREQLPDHCGESP